MEILEQWHCRRREVDRIRMCFIPKSIEFDCED